MAPSKELGDILVIGGCGYLGYHLVHRLNSEGVCSSIHIMSRNPTHKLDSAATYHAGDIADYQQLSSLLSKIKPRVIFNVASPKYTASEKFLRHTNIDGVRNLLKCATESPTVCALVFTGTDSAIVQASGKLTEDEAKLYTEDSRATLANAYARTKAVADVEVRAANGPNLSTAVLRIPGLYGEDDDNCIGALLNTVKKGQHKVQVGENKNHFEFVYVESACAAHILAAQALVGEGHASPAAGEAFFISDGVSMPYFDFARKVYAFTGHPVAANEIQIMPFWLVLGFATAGEWFYWLFTLGKKTPAVRKLGILHLTGGSEWDITKAKIILGYVPADQDAVLKKVVELEAKRLGI